jgi:hypothetical protein
MELGKRPRYLSSASASVSGTCRTTMTASSSTHRKVKGVEEILLLHFERLALSQFEQSVFKHPIISRRV